MRVMITGPYPYAPNRVGGGVQAVTHYLAQAIASMPDVEVEVVTLTHESKAKVAHFGKVRVHYVPGASSPNRPLAERVRAQALSSAIRQAKPDIVNAHVAGLYAWAASLSGLPWVLTPHGVQSIEARLHPGSARRGFRYWKAQRTERLNVRRARHIISNSQFIREYLSRYIRGEVYDIDNPVAEKFFDVADRSTHNRLLVVGKLIYRKGIHVLLDALPAVLETHPEVKVRFAGSTAAGKEPQAYWAGIERQVGALGLNDAVSFLGELDDPDLLDEYAECGAVVSASSMETSAMGILEAMAAGRPIVGTRVGGTPWLIEHERNGLLVDPNDPMALARGLNQLLSDERARHEMGRQSKAMAEARCRADIVAAQTMRVFRKIVKDQPGA